MRKIVRATLPVQVAEEIKRDIMRKRLKPSTRLPTENELANELGVGRPTLREALRILQGQGWIKLKFGEGAYVMESPKISRKTADYLQKEKTLELLEHEIAQLEQEGKDIASGMIRKKFQKLKKHASPEEVEDFYDSLESLDQRPDYPYTEPSELEEIRKEVPGQKPVFCHILDESAILERTYGAWMGRCVGCLLGKPVEEWTKEGIEKYLKATDSYPLRDYFPYEPAKMSGSEHVLHYSANEATLGNIHYMPRDDDLDYTILNLKMVEDNGPEFTTEDVAEEWLLNFPYQMIFTAERQAYANLVNGLKASASATHRNPFREWIGAQIRGDIFGYLAPGNPELAASLAYKDARLSHTKNGIYGEMFVAAALSTALVGSSLDDVVDAGLSQVPRKSRLAEMVGNVRNWSKKENSWQAVWEKTNEKYGKYHHIHTLPNLAFVLIGLFWGELDFKKTVSIAVMCGSDTDCNGASAGSIIGTLKGNREIPKHMGEPLNDTIKSAVYGYSNFRISELAKRTFQLAQRIQQSKMKEISQ